MAIADNMVVSLSYELRDVASNDVLDSNIGGQPLEFMMGRGNIIPGLEKEIALLNVGDNARIVVKAAEAYGEYDNSAVESYPKEQFAGLELFVGQTLYGQDEMGRTVEVVVKSFNDEEVTVDYNHPLAGKDLMFDVTIADVRMPTPEESLSGQVGGGGCCGGGGSCGGEGHGHSHGEHNHGGCGCSH